jgi:transcription antitermination protein NusB
MKSRTRARSLALQVLYEVDMTGHLPGVVLEERLEESHSEGEIELTPELVEFSRQIISGIIPIAEKLDDVIASYAPEWPFDQIAAIDRNILRIATWEFAVSRQTPLKVAINEAVELAKLYGSDAVPRFINGVLGSLADREHEIIQKLKKDVR